MKILIAGLAKTGTTGLLYLIANSMGPERKLLFEPEVCPPGITSETGNVIAKILIGKKLNAASFAHFDKKITIVRDPRDRIISALLYSQFHAKYLNDDVSVQKVHDVLKLKESNPSSVSVGEILELMDQISGNKRSKKLHMRKVRNALNWFDEYVIAMPDGLLYKYEDFVSGDYAPLVKHLDIPISGAAEVPERLSRVIRTKGYGDWRNWFTPADIQELRPELDPWLAKHGYDEADWTLNSEPVISPDHCSGYFLKLVVQARVKVPQGHQSGARKCKIIRAEPSIVSGWAIGANPVRPIEVALIVNDKEVSQALADKPRPGLKERGVHPTGLCGFVFRFKAGKSLKVGDRVHIKVVGADVGFDNPESIVKEANSRA